METMKIGAIEVYPVKIRQETAYLGNVDGAAQGGDYYKRPEYRSLYSRNLETLLVKITTECGQYGWGEALAPVGPEIAAEVIKRLFEPLLLGEDPRNIGVIWSRLYDSMRERGYFTGFLVDAIAAVDVALWDLFGKSAGLPVYQLLGGAYCRQIPAYVSGLPRQTNEERIALALEWKRQGFRAIKLHLGFGVREDAAVAAALREALGEDFTLMVDVHWKYTVPEAIQLGRLLERQNIAFLEAPTAPEDVDGTAEVARALDMAVAIGEAKRTRYQFKERLQKRAGDIVQPDAGRTGITELKRIAELAECHHVPVSPHLSVGLGICIAASIQVSAAIPNLYMLEYQPTVFPAANSLLRKPLVCEAGYYQLPDGPGLGVEIDESKLTGWVRL